MFQAKRATAWGLGHKEDVGEALEEELQGPLEGLQVLSDKSSRPRGCTALHMYKYASIHDMHCIALHYSTVHYITSHHITFHTTTYVYDIHA